jgi:hypothetical protein
MIILRTGINRPDEMFHYLALEIRMFPVLRLNAKSASHQGFANKLN